MCASCCCTRVTPLTAVLQDKLFILPTVQIATNSKDAAQAYSATAKSKVRRVHAAIRAETVPMITAAEVKPCQAPLCRLDLAAKSSRTCCLPGRRLSARGKLCWPVSRRRRPSGSPRKRGAARCCAQSLPSNPVRAGPVNEFSWAIDMPALPNSIYRETSFSSRGWQTDSNLSHT